MSNHQQQVAEGLTGTITSIFLSIPAWLLDVEFAMKMLCLILSGIASIFTIVKMLKKKR
ncbi:hypothetical protein UFOVP636_14 [uncultured Caudovirales phage]|uniref:Uncharacterized protein n=1 Tax=uncultured Caudovirales phage TaxID=2100421 RepID=A0A6J5N927_9CAUD|nr:hypothetical protein UFOVP636_14 [uncultured Caudovirales phage]